MPEIRRSFVLSFCIGGLVGGGIVLLLSRCLTKTKRSRSTGKDNVRSLYDKTLEQPNENSVYCAPEGAGMRYNLGEKIYYSSGD